MTPSSPVSRPGPLWTPSAQRVGESNASAFMQSVEDDWNVTIDDWNDLERFALERPERFWVSLKDFAAVAADTWGDDVLIDGDKMPGAKWFPDARLNYAENLLKRRDDADALVFYGENRVSYRLSFKELYDRVSRFAQALEAAGVTEGDRVAAYMPNMPETIIAMLASASLGAVWSSCSPDFGVQGVLDRFGQIEPKVLIAVAGYYYNGKSHDTLGKTAEVVSQLPSVKKCVIVPYAFPAADASSVRGGVPFDDFIAPYAPDAIDFVMTAFNHPLFIMFSSGTTGVPKCIVHGAGGTLLQHAKEHLLHSDIKPDDRVFYFTTCGWMMWNWLVSALASQATLLLYDGSPFYPDGNALFAIADKEAMTHFGTSAKYIDALKKAGLRPRDSHRLSTLRAMLSTGSPLVAEAFDYVYDAIKPDLHLASISGGTDIISCFLLGNPTAPVWRGEIQCRGLAMAVEVFDDDGRPLAPDDGGDDDASEHRKGELVCTRPFPSMPIAFWNDPGDAKYKSAYFERFAGVWTHGDYVARTMHGGYVIYGRSDATLNPGGVRIGTAEIYRQVEKMDAVQEAIVIGQQWDGDVRVVLFVRLKDGLTLDDALIQKIRAQIRANCTPRHVPAKVLQVPDIPRTKSGKITELAVRDVVHGRAIKNKEALANPEALEHFANRPELRD
ncbi:acetoacetate--CoA ligase [Varunaivibrio sulfuroxidans]|uniref:Acetoacetyl-CoA synthetase n=1 Tax=Varunaivibrio sulfuroxidans TaxID=1773489 RepID=A0A4R3JFZ6_9PROT|nr:acetoacetate--CoA ligase [Varunaivibrio sulfuroxidans]TCS64777.1 acetoacetyl-CoA synthetase [Varunaivibrio sulfuroxidans]WES29918.1 acetoacetate--CoA ligase [Varunaivibrio sulfuroxidans]